MMKDIMGSEVREGSLVCYSRSSGCTLRIAIVTGISIANVPRGTYTDLLQVAEINKPDIKGKWQVFSPKMFLVLDMDDMPVQIVDDYYKLQSKLSEWNEAGKNIHERDSLITKQGN